MDLKQTVCSANNEINKRKFTIKPINKDGLVLQIHHTTNELRKIRFANVCFHNKECILAAADLNGCIFLVDFALLKFWNLSSDVVNSCTVLKFSPWNEDDLLIGLNNGTIHLLNIHTGRNIASLTSHNYPVTELSFSCDFFCLSSSHCEAVIWDLKTNSKVQVLTLETDCVLKHVFFTPVNSDILACFHDDVIHIWKYGTYENYKQILPTTWNNFSVKTIAFTRNGKVALIAGSSSTMAAFALNTWCLAKTITLPHDIQSVKKLLFIPHLFDGGNNRVLAVLSGNGILYLFDIEANCVLENITGACEIIKFEISNDGKYVACVFCSGEVFIYDIVKLLVKCRNKTHKTVARTRRKTNIFKKSICKNHLIKEQVSDILDIDKLRAILKEFGQYPNSYRVKIWQHLLQLPNNIQHYNAVINRVKECCFNNLMEEYPLENKIALKNTKRLLNNLVTWCPFFAHVRYLPVFVFPFVKIFQNEPVLCFEALCTILVNWCQHWFEYYPLPPVNILAMIENILIEHDPELLNHLNLCDVTSEIYGWSLLESVFSEVLSASEWCIFWDHVITNEPSFLLMGVAAYNILNRNVIISMSDKSDIKEYYRRQNPIDIKKWISKSYALLNKTSERNHPRIYLNFFSKLGDGSYPVFTDFPKTFLNYENHQLLSIENIKKEATQYEEDILKQRMEYKSKIARLEIKNEENARLQELEKACRKKISEEEQRVKLQYEKLLELQKTLHEEEVEILVDYKNKMIEQNTKDKKLKLERLVEDIDHNKNMEDLEMKKAEIELTKHYRDLMKNKLQLEELLKHDLCTVQIPVYESSKLYKQQQLLLQEIEKIKQKTCSKNHLKQMNIAAGIEAMDDLIQDIEMQLANEISNKRDDVDKGATSIRVLQLQKETEELEQEIGKLLNLLARSKMRQSECKIRQLQMHIVDGKLDAGQSSIRQNRYDHQQKVTTQQEFERDYVNLKKLLHIARDGYEAPPGSPDSNDQTKKCKCKDKLCCTCMPKKVDKFAT